MGKQGKQNNTSILVRWLLLALIALLPGEFAFANAKLASALDWVDNDCKNHCCGHFMETITPSLYTPDGELVGGAIRISADEVVLKAQGLSELEGHVLVESAGRTLSADRALLWRDDESKKVTRIKLFGHVKLREPGHLIVGRFAYLDLQNNTGYLQRARYRMSTTKGVKQLQADAQDVIGERVPMIGLTLWGQADKVKQKAKGVYVVHDATYSSCRPTNPTWQLHASTIKLNQNTGWGSAHHATLHLHDVPVLYLPYAKFPIDDRRHSGLMLPQIHVSKSSGVDVSIPVYLNLAPNYDLLLTPRVLSKRGLFLQSMLRYLTPKHEGKLRLGFIAQDNEFTDFQEDTTKDILANVTLTPEVLKELDMLNSASKTRYMVSWQEHAHFNVHWFADVDINKVSDDYFLQDFGGLGLSTMDNQLAQRASLHYQDSHWSAQLDLERYQTLHPVNRVMVPEQYHRLPSLTAHGIYPEAFAGMDFMMNVEMVNFDRHRDPGETINPVHGQRFHFAPRLAKFVSLSNGIIVTPSVTLDMTHYHLTDAPIGLDGSHTRALPIVAMNISKTVETMLESGAGTWIQTFEPRLYYLWIPNTQQHSIPIFDSHLNTVTYDQLFRENRFSGLDRVNDAHQVSLGFTSRMLSPNTGREFARVSIGEAIHFHERHVDLCERGATTCVSSRDMTGLALQREDRRTLSPIAGVLDIMPTDEFSIVSNATFDPYEARFDTADIDLQYHPKPNQLVNVGWHFLRQGDVLDTSVTDAMLPDADIDNLHQLGASFTMPISAKVSAIGALQYNISHHHTQSALAGFEYDTCCWALRALAGQTLKGLDEKHDVMYNKAFYLQWKLKGLGDISTHKPVQVLKQRINGFVDTFAAH